MHICIDIYYMHRIDLTLLRLIDGSHILPSASIADKVILVWTGEPEYTGLAL